MTKPHWRLFNRNIKISKGIVLTVSFILIISDISLISYHLYKSRFANNLLTTHNKGLIENEPQKLINSKSEDIGVTMNENYIVGKRFKNFCASGEWGTFNEDGTISIRWGLDYAGPKDSRPFTGEGNWSIKDEVLTISNSSISNGTYKDFNFYKVGKDLFAVPSDTHCEMNIGTDFDKIDIFYKEHFLFL